MYGILRVYSIAVGEVRNLDTLSSSLVWAWMAYDVSSKALVYNECLCGVLRGATTSNVFQGLTDCFTPGSVIPHGKQHHEGYLAKT